MSNYGFIITRHVNSVNTNKYWNQSVKLIRTFYPLKQIIIIDDNSKQELVKADFEYKNVTIIQSEYHGRGELLPYVYYLKYKWFPNAVILHDSVFVHRRIPFELFNLPVMPLWHHIYDKENVNNLLRISSVLTNKYNLIKKINGEETNILGLNNIRHDAFILCFGCQAYIKLSFLELLQKKYNITNLVNVIRNRTDRCSLERIMGLLFCEEYPNLLKIKSLFGDIITKNKTFRYNYDQYKVDLKNGKIIYPFVKVWTGR
jgi:hypothetical protein